MNHRSRKSFLEVILEPISHFINQVPTKNEINELTASPKCRQPLWDQGFCSYFKRTIHPRLTKIKKNNKSTI